MGLFFSSRSEFFASQLALFFDAASDLSSNSNNLWSFLEVKYKTANCKYLGKKKVTKKELTSKDPDPVSSKWFSISSRFRLFSENLSLSLCPEALSEWVLILFTFASSKSFRANCILATFTLRSGESVSHKNLIAVVDNGCTDIQPERSVINYIHINITSTPNMQDG